MQKLTKSERRNLRRSQLRCCKREHASFSMLFDLVQDKAFCHAYWSRMQNGYVKKAVFKESDNIECHFHKTFHRLMVEYVINPIDVNLLGYYKDGKLLSYSML